ncbi:hypothetical protein N7491_011020 [Penicillium cf. griseofulvum]|uniref:Uncharacterized protein n=1 Tax=Penicillium cf. griseofulvum TaxID=2972120 RepID=A0A9W9N198_9EURO|nr:hypothetical protein N7472_001339 [Penicillium cf. griseofulvum]KAJ5422575.1 hypothetical protein N7491_011020 [Penicillium cf. griseofulvum]KAJ5428753.1 hypothetical protein N7445_010207 [Penicillium cf. griseofulvum]
MKPGQMAKTCGEDGKSGDKQIPFSTAMGLDVEESSDEQKQEEREEHILNEFSTFGHIRGPKLTRQNAMRSEMTSSTWNRASEF